MQIELINVQYGSFYELITIDYNQLYDLVLIKSSKSL